MVRVQKNPRRLALELRQQPDPDLWRKWVVEIRQILTNYYLEHGYYPQKASKIARIDWLRRMFDSHGSNLAEAVEAAEDDQEYWDRLVNHPGGSYADVIPFESVSVAFIELQKSPGYNRNTFKFYLRSA